MAINKSNPYVHSDIAYSSNIPWSYAASGGTISSFIAEDSSNEYNQLGATYRVHTFDTVGTSEIVFDRRGIIDVLVIAGGGAGGAARNNYCGGGGGAGGVVQRYGILVDPGPVEIVVGVGASVSENSVLPNNGGNSSFSNIVAIGGGGGHDWYDQYRQVGGGSSGGGWYGAPINIPGQGCVGGWTYNSSAGAGGGGAGKHGGSPTWFTDVEAGNGGDGIGLAFATDSITYYAGGGAGGVRGTYTNPVASGGLGGGGGQRGTPGSNYNGADATFYGSGGGGGASVSNNNYWYRGGNGYKGVVIVRYITNPA